MQKLNCNRNMGNSESSQSSSFTDFWNSFWPPWEQKYTSDDGVQQVGNENEQSSNTFYDDTGNNDFVVISMQTGSNKTCNNLEQQTRVSSAIEKGLEGANKNASVQQKYEAEIRAMNERHQSEIHRLNQKIDHLTRQFNNLEQQTNKNAGVQQKYEAEIREMNERHLNDQSEIHRLNQKIDHLTRQLAMEWSHKVSSDESNIENVNVKNRPMNIADQMQQLITQEWLEVKNSLDDQCGGIEEKTKHGLLCSVLLKSEEIARIHFDELLKQVYHCLKGGVKTYHSSGPSDTHQSVQDQSTRGLDSSNSIDISTIPHLGQLRTGIGEFFRYSADDFDTTPIVQKTREELLKDYYPILTAIEGDENMKTYFTAAASLAWKMIVQRPPMVFDVRGVGKPYDHRRLELYYNSTNGPKSVIQYFVYPSLLHGTQIMVKGKVFVQ